MGRICKTRKILFTLLVLVIPVIAQSLANQDINISGKVTDIDGNSISDAIVGLKKAGLSVTTRTDGTFLLKSKTGLSISQNSSSSRQSLTGTIKTGRLLVETRQTSAITVTLLSLEGKSLSAKTRLIQSGGSFVTLPRMAVGMALIQIATIHSVFFLKAFSTGTTWYGTTEPIHYPVSTSHSLAKQTVSGMEFNDTLTAGKQGYIDFKLSLGTSDTSGLVLILKGKSDLKKFSFFVTSLNSMRALSGSQNGFGGDLRFGEKGPGAGLRGADKICAAVAERGMPGSSVKQWRAFLCVSEDENGKQVNAIERIGNGPWYDRLGRVVSNTKEELLNQRPAGAHPQIKNDLPNEFGVPNSNPDGTGELDNHHFLTGSNERGELADKSMTCNDWTSTDKSAGRPRYGYSFSVQSRIHWISGHEEAGCGAGIHLTFGQSANLNNPVVGSGGGYGGIYCFALVP